MQRKQQRQWRDPSSMSSDDGLSFGEGARTRPGLSTPVSSSAPLKLSIRHERGTLADGFAIQRVSFSLVTYSFAQSGIF